MEKHNEFEGLNWLSIKENRFLNKDPEEMDSKSPEKTETGKEKVEKTKAGVEAKKSTVKETSEMKREFVKKEIKEKPKASKLTAPTKTGKMAKDEFIEKIKQPKKRKKLDWLVINQNNDGFKFDALRWDATTPEGVDEIYSQCSDLEIPVTDTFYQEFFATLKDRTINLPTDPEQQKWYHNPASYMQQLLAHDPEYAFAFQHFQYLQGRLVKQDKDMKEVLDKQRDLDTDPVAGKVTDFLSSNVKAFQKAIKEKDFATAGVYVVGIWALYRSYKELTKNDNGRTTKWLAYGLAAYCGTVFAKKAGYDILKIAGFRDNDYEVKGTPLEVIDNILRNNPGTSELAKELDYDIVLRSSEISLVDLDTLYEKSNDKGVQFINPKNFASIFPIAEEWPFDLGIGEDGVEDYTGNSNKKLTAAQREFLRVGQQLYKLARALRESYNVTLKLDHPEYKGKAYREAIREDKRKFAKVRHMFAAMQEYAPDYKKKFFVDEGVKEARAHLHVLNEKDIGFTIENQIEKSGHYRGSIMGYPVMFVRVDGGYRVYLIDQYGSKDVPGLNFDATIPIDANDPNLPLEINKIKSAVKARYNYLLQFFEFQQGTEPKYQNGQWTVTGKLEGAAEFDLKGEDVTFLIEPYNNGKGITLTAKKGGIRINVSEEAMKQNPIAPGLINAVVSQEEFHALRVFSNADQIKVFDIDKASRTFTMAFGKSELPLKFKYNPTTKKYEVDPKDEKKLLENPAFSNSYIEALQADDKLDLNVVKEKLKTAIQTTPENYLQFIWEKLTGTTLSPQMGGVNLDFISGSVPDYLANTVTEVSYYESMQKVRRGAQKVDNFKDLEDTRMKILVDTYATFQFAYDLLSSTNMDISSWDRDKFMTDIIRPLREAGTESTAYLQSKTDFEVRVYKLMGFTKSDFAKQPHKNAADLMNVYAYYCAHLDNEQYTYKHGGKKKTHKLDLDTMKTPPTPLYEKQTTDPYYVPEHLDPGLRGFAILNYFKYVQSEILTKAKSQSSLDNLPDGSAKAFWGIDEFDQWVKNQPNYKPLDSLDNYPGWEHDVSVHTNESLPIKKRYTELDKQARKEFQKGRDFLVDTFGMDVINKKAIDDYLINEAKPGVAKSDVGILSPLKHNGKTRCSLWDMTNSIRSNKRSVQYQQIQILVQKHLVEYVLHPDNMPRFFYAEVPLKVRLLQKWPGLADVSWWPDALNPLAP